MVGHRVKHHEHLNLSHEILSGHLLIWGPELTHQYTLMTLLLTTLFYFYLLFQIQSYCFYSQKSTLKPWVDQPKQHIKSQRYHFANKGPSSQSYGFSSSHVRMWELDHKENWVLKKYFQTVVLEKTLEGPLDWKITPVNPQGNQPWIFIGRADTEAKASVPISTYK